VEHLAELRLLYQRSKLLLTKLLEPVPGDVFLLQPGQNLLGQAGEVPQGASTLPHPVLDAFRPLEAKELQTRPVLAQLDLEQLTHNPPLGLGDVDHILLEREPLQADFLDVDLEQNVHLLCPFFLAPLDWDRYLLHQCLEL